MFTGINLLLLSLLIYGLFYFYKYIKFLFSFKSLLL